MKHKRYTNTNKNRKPHHEKEEDPFVQGVVTHRDIKCVLMAFETLISEFSTKELNDKMPDLSPGEVYEVYQKFLEIDETASKEDERINPQQWGPDAEYIELMKEN